MLRRFGVAAVSSESGQTIVAAAVAQAELEPLAGYGDTVARGDLAPRLHRRPEGH